MEVSEIVKHPITAVSVVVGTIGQLGFGWFEPIWGLLSATAGTWFAIGSVSATTILPRLGYEEIATPLLLGLAILFVAVQLDRLGEKAMRYFRNR